MEHKNVKEELIELQKELEYSELEDRLEMAQIAAAETVRCNIGSVETEK